MASDTPGDDDASTERQRDGDSRHLSRRRLVASGAATWATVSLAGCNRITDPGTSTPTVTTETTTTGTTTTENDSDGTSTDQSTQDTTTTTTTDAPTTTTADSGPGTTTSCEIISLFSPGMEIGIHTRVRDPETGAVLGDEDIEAATLEFPDAEYGPKQLNWNGPHERYSEDTWGSKIVTDSDTEPGTYEYEITVLGKDGTEATIAGQFSIA